jgi:DNA polymerase-3 subunit gamma/tau
VSSAAGASPAGGAQSATTWSTAAIGADETAATGAADAPTPPTGGTDRATAADPAPGATAVTGRAPSAPARGIAQGSRYGEAVVREILGAQFIHEETIAPKVSPQAPPVEGA